MLYTCYRLIVAKVHWAVGVRLLTIGRAGKGALSPSKPRYQKGYDGEVRGEGGDKRHNLPYAEISSDGGAEHDQRVSALRSGHIHLL